jgi:hypothetical protein
VLVDYPDPTDMDINAVMAGNLSLHGLHPKS